MVGDFGETIRRQGLKIVGNWLSFSFVAVIAILTFASAPNAFGLGLAIAIAVNWFFVAKPRSYRAELLAQEIQVVEGKRVWVIPENVHLQGKQIIAFQKDETGSSYLNEPEVNPKTGQVTIGAPDELTERRFIVIMRI